MIDDKKKIAKLKKRIIALEDGLLRSRDDFNELVRLQKHQKADSYEMAIFAFHSCTRAIDALRPFPKRLIPKKVKP